jgi:hypothetical protein
VLRKGTEYEVPMHSCSSPGPHPPDTTWRPSDPPNTKRTLNCIAVNTDADCTLSSTGLPNEAPGPPEVPNAYLSLFIPGRRIPKGFWLYMQLIKSLYLPLLPLLLSSLPHIASLYHRQNIPSWTHGSNLNPLPMAPEQ